VPREQIRGDACTNATQAALRREVADRFIEPGCWSHTPLLVAASRRLVEVPVAAVTSACITDSSFSLSSTEPNVMD
jgi:hypothetical protein